MRFTLLAAMTACGSALLTTACSSHPAPRTDPQADPRVGLKAVLMDAGEAISNLKVVAKAVSPPGFLGVTNSDLAFTGNYAVQGNYNGPVIWDISNPANPVLVAAYTCPASQNDVSVFKNLMFMSAEATNGRVDCKPGGVPDTVSQYRMRGVRIFDISDIRNPKLVKNVQTCRGSHTHTVLEDPADKENIYIYVSGSSSARSPNELPGCNRAAPYDPNSSLWRIEIIKVPVNNPERAEVVNRANIFTGLTQPAVHGAAEEDIANARRNVENARRTGGFVARSPTTGQDIVLGANFVRAQLDTIMRARGGSSTPTAADTATLRANLQDIVNRNMTPTTPAAVPGVSPIASTSQCHDITVYPSIGLAGGACQGHGILLDIKDPTNPVRIDAVADSNFAFWHSATFNNDGTKLLFSDEWGGGTQPRCRASDKPTWGANAIFTLDNNRKLTFESYYKIPAAQTSFENCVAHNGSLIPIPGRDVMIQGWYQGGISVFDWTDPSNPFEIASFDRGPVDSTRLVSAGSWSAYWYNGAIVSSEIARGLDVAELVPSEHLTQNEIDAAKTVKWDYLNVQGQPKIVWPPSFPLVKAYVDQLERSKCMSGDRISSARQAITRGERATGPARAIALETLSTQLATDAASCDQPKVALLRKALNDLGNVIVP